jgi:hypothetical protein
LYSRRHSLHISLFYPFHFELASLEVQKQFLVRFFLLKLLQHIATVILSRLHFSLLLELVHFKFKLFDLSHQVIIFLSNLIITHFHTHLTCGGFIVG